MEDGSEELPTSKRQRIETLTLAPPSSPTTTKGKEKMEDSGVDVDACNPPDATCAICLTDGERSIRGRIDSCEHFFCFICIMEWAKIESRCPACKRRFRSIRRPPVPGLFSCERIVTVQHRDQGSYCYGDQNTELSDPYANVNCNTCQSFADESLLLLCDLCDSAHHTYCVGLGFTVPEGDWYCHDCTISRAEHSNSRSDDGCYNQNDNRNSVATNMDSLQNFPRFCTNRLEEQRNGEKSSSSTSGMASESSDLSLSQNIPAMETVSPTCHPAQIAPNPSISIFEIVSEEQRNGGKPSLRNSSRRKSQGSTLHVENSVPVGRTASSTQAGSDKGARTLHHCRNLHSRIRALRENWDYLRAGVLAFSSSASCLNGKVRDRHQKGNRVSSDLPATSSSVWVNSSQVTTDGNVSREKQKKRGLQDVSRAWKMMEIAKTLRGSQKSTVSNNLNICGRTKRTGSLQPTAYNGKVHDRHQKGNSVSSDLPTTSSSVWVNSSQVTTDGNVSREKQKKRSLQDSNKAWKMMKIAKSLRGIQKSTVSNNLNICGRTKRTGSLQPTSFYKSNISSQKVAASNELEPFRHFPLKIEQNKCKPVDYKKQTSCMTTTKEMKQTYRGSENRHLLVNSTLSGTKQRKFSPNNIYDEKEEPAYQWPLEKVPTSFSECNAHFYPLSAAYLHPEASSQNVTTMIESSQSEVERHRWRQDACTDTDASMIRRNGIAKSSIKDRNADQSQIRRRDTANNSAKGEVQSLVKINLKLLNKDRHLDTDKFKEVARTATHSIMAACGLEHRESSCHSFSGSICRHSEQIKQLRKSNLMPNSCRECFFAYVKNVVDSILLEGTSIQSQ